MAENILVVEYEPRYTDRVRNALAGQPYQAWYAKDGEEAMRLLQVERPSLIVLSSVIPKIATVDLIRAIRANQVLAKTPILVTVSGYTGKNPAADAQKVGATDILPKPYSETEFLGKVHHLLGHVFVAHPAGVSAGGEGTLTSNEIFGDIFEDEHPAAPGAKAMKPKDDVDKMLADKLAGVMPQKKKEGTLPGTTPLPKPPDSTRPKVASSAELDKMLHDTLSGVRKVTAPGTTPVPRPTAVPPPAGPPPPAPKSAEFLPDDVHMSQPILPTISQPLKVEDEDPGDGTKFGQYVLIEKIAVGGMAEVWKARMKGVEGFQKIVAIKKILPHLSDNQDFIEMFVDEAKLAAQLNHNNIIHIYDLGKIQSSYYIAMEYIDGHDLKSILRRGQEREQPMTVEVALFVAAKIAAALDYAHRKRDFENRDMGLVHRDVSPQNVLISQEGDIKLCDFGIAKAASKASHTQAGALKGKLQYMSPEQAWGRNIDRRSDIFALGAVLFEMLTARKLFTGDNEMSVLEQVREAQIVPPSQLNEEVMPEIDRIVLKALEKDPANRYQTAGEMEKEINAILYSFRPTPTSADLAIYMHRLWVDEHVVPSLHEAPTLIEKPQAAAPARSAAGVVPAVPAVAAPAPKMPAWESSPAIHPPKKGAPVVPIIVGVIVILGAAGGYLYFRSQEGRPATTVAGTATARPAITPPAAAPATTMPGSGMETATIVPATPVLDTAQVNEEVQKRLAAERDRLEQVARQQLAAQQAAAAAPPPVSRPAPAPAPVTQPPAATTTQAAAPPPAPVVTATEAPAPAPQTATQAAETRPAPAPATVREGDLVPAGTEGLVPARLLRRGNVPYPPLARSQRIEGTVIVNVLVSERGQVLDVRVISGVNRPVGLNEAAMQMMRRSTFQPATKDGVRVRTWTTVPVDFKL